MKRTHVNLAEAKDRGIEALKGTNVPAVFCDAVRVQLADCALLSVSGKVATDSSGRVVGRTMAEQTRQVLENIKSVLEHEGGTLSDIVRVRVYVTRADKQALTEIHEVRSRYFVEGRYPASTLVRVSGLIRDGALIEIDADAVIAT